VLKKKSDAAKLVELQSASADTVDRKQCCSFIFFMIITFWRFGQVPAPAHRSLELLRTGKGAAFRNAFARAVTPLQPDDSVSDGPAIH
jgi:hypothetical protein